ncbi:hypothetical protein EV714DRAFT_206914 [Schizophyllum commune]
MSSIVASAILRRISSALFSSNGIANTPKLPKTILSLPNETLNEIACLLDKPTLVTLVLVNRRFHALVEPIIWRELSSLVPILRLLPEYFVEESMLVVKAASLCLQDIDRSSPQRPVGPELPKDLWYRSLNILRLASHVKKLLLHPISDLPRDCMHSTFSDHGYQSMNWESLKLVARSIRQESAFVLFPNLQHLEVDSCLSNGINSVKLLPFLGPSVTTFVAHCSLTRLYLCLRRCEINSFSYYEPSRTLYGRLKPANRRDALLIPAVGAMAQEIDTLHTLRLRLNHGSGLLALLQPASGTLRTLDIEIVSLADTTADFHLKSLRSLTVRKQTTAFARALAGSTRLEHVDLDDVYIRNADDIDKTLRRLAESPLRRVRIHESPQNTSALWSIEPQHLHVLASSRHLVELDIRASSSVSLGDDDWAILLPSWPFLKSLKLRPCSPPHRRGGAWPTGTLNTLVHFATHCRKLEELELPLLIGEIPDLPRSYSVTQRWLRVLDFGCPSLIRAEVDPARVARFLHALFPNLRDLRVTPKVEDVGIWDEAVRSELAA